MGKKKKGKKRYAVPTNASFCISAAVLDAGSFYTLFTGFCTSYCNLMGRDSDYKHL